MFKIHEPVTVVSADVIFGLKDKFDFQMQASRAASLPMYARCARTSVLVHAHAFVERGRAP